MTFLDKEWSRNHFKDIQNKAGKRYTPELNIELHLVEVFDGLARTEAFYTNVRSHYGKLSKGFRSTTSVYKNGTIQKTFDAYSKNIKELLGLLEKIKKYETTEIPWSKINTLTKKSQALSWKLSDQIRKEKEKPVQNEPLDPANPNSYPRTGAEMFSHDLHSISESQKEARFFEDFSKSVSAATSNKPFLLINGLAGSGKTHLLCDLVKHRIDKNYAPTVLAFGEFFQGTDPWERVARQARIDTKIYDKSKILAELDRKGRIAKSRSILIIDAINESPATSFWKRNLSAISREIKKYPNVALVISIRSGFEKEVLPESANSIFNTQEHRGFEFQEWEAVTRFFKEFSIPLPEIPLLTPEFQNPLFLLLFCQAFANTTDDSFKGHEGATKIFEKYVDSVSKKIETKFNIDHGTGKNIWDTVIEKVAEHMVEQNTDRLFETDVLNLIDKSHPTLDAQALLLDIEKSFLLVKVPHYAPGLADSQGFDYRFPFQRFSDHLIGRFLFKKYEKEFGRTNKNLITASKFFSKRRKLGKYLDRSFNRGIIEALSIQCPEQLNGIEFFEVAPYINSYIGNDAFLQSIIWRKPSAFSSDLKKPLEFINKRVVPYSNGNSEVLNAFLSVTVVPKHPFNANYLHGHLGKMKMPQRDAWWSTFLHDQYRERGSVDRLLNWSWSDQDISHFSDESITLAVTALGWFLTTPNRFVRDKATKGVVNLLQDRTHLIKPILEKFEKVDDMYITERLLAAAYGSVLRNKKDKESLKNLANYIYRNYFKDDKPRAHILIRDYASGIIEIARINGVKLKFSVAKTQPPYKSVWPTNVPSAKTLRKKYYPDEFFKGETKERGFLDIWSSVNYNEGSLGDFGNYEVNSHLGAWSGRKLKNPEANRKELLDKFKKNLSPEQGVLFEKSTNPFYGVDLSSISKSIKFKDMSNEALNEMATKDKLDEAKEEKELQQRLNEFEASLDSQKKRYSLKEIKPFLDKRGSVNDPYELFDTSFAQRWIFNRVVQLGYDPKLHGTFDNRVNRYDNSGRSNHKAERIGKKYQWIALHEFTALVSDHFEFTGRYWGNRTGKYLGAWNPYMRDIDPSLLIQNDKKIKEEAEFTRWRSGHGKYEGLNKIGSESKWVKEIADIPDPKNIIEILDDNEKAWLALKGIFVWQKETPPELEKYDYPTRELFYILNSFIVKKSDLKKITKWVEKKGHGNWLPESHNWYETFIGEFPDSSSFEDLRGDHNIWVKPERKGDRADVSLTVTDDDYLNEFTLDCSRDENISIMLPSRFLVDKMHLEHPELDGRFRNKKGELTIYATSVSEENMPSALIADKTALLDFLDKNDYAIFWTLLSEKLFIGGSRTGREFRSRLNIYGVYSFDSKRSLKGVMGFKPES